MESTFLMQGYFSVKDAILGDFDMDGFDDVILASVVDDRIKYFKNTADGFEQYVDLIDEHIKAWDLEMQDTDNDGDLDIVIY